MSLFRPPAVTEHTMLATAHHQIMATSIYGHVDISMSAFPLNVRLSEQSIEMYQTNRFITNVTEWDHLRAALR
jgi:hypothetical protein